MTRSRIWIAGTGGALLSFAMTSTAVGVNLKVTPSVAAEGVYDSNLFSTPTNEISDFYLKVVPAMRLSLELPATSVDLNGSFEIDRYVKHDELDSARGVVNLGLSATKPIQVSPRFTLAPTAKYLETNDSFWRTQLTQVPTPGLPPSDTLVVGRVRTRETAASLWMTYFLSPGADLAFGGAYSRRVFLDNRPDLLDSDISNVGTSMSFSVTPRFSVGPFLSANRTRYEDGRRTEVYGGGALFTYLPGPQYALTMRLGPEFLRDFGPGGVLLEETWLPVADITGKYIHGDFTGTLGVFYGPAGGAVVGVTTNRGSVIATAASRFTERWDWSLAAIYQANVSATGVRSADYSTFEFDAGMGYQLTRWARLVFSGTFFRQWAQLPFGVDISRESAYAGVDLFTTYPLF